MKPFEFMRVYHPKLGIFVDKHVGSGIIVDNIFKPMKSFVKKVAKQSGKKALKSGVSHLSKKTSEKSGDLIMEKLRNMKISDAGHRAKIVPPIKQQEESTDMIINRLISGSGVKRRSRVKIM